jgi:hypothetical protein
MAAFRPANPLVVYVDNTFQPLAGGELRFYDTLTETPKSVYSDSALSVNLGNEVTLDSAGRLPSDVWGSGVYRVRLYDADGVLVDEADPVQEEGGAGASIPSQSGNSGKFLTTNGSSLSWASVREVPDPSGNANKVLSTDGTSLSWIAKPADGAAGTSDVSQTTTEFSVNDMYVLSGTGTGTNLGGRTQAATVVFATPFTTTPVWIGIQVTNSSLSSGTNMPSWAIPTSSTTGFTVNFTMGEIDDSQSQYNFNAAVTFKYVAIGLRV